MSESKTVKKKDARWCKWCGCGEFYCICPPKLLEAVEDLERAWKEEEAAWSEADRFHAALRSVVDQISPDSLDPRTHNAYAKGDLINILRVVEDACPELLSDWMESYVQG